jgi:hypothetical protein
MQDVERQTGGAVKLGPGTLYGTLKRLLADGLVAEAGEEDHRRYYRLTALGWQAAKAEAERLAMLVRKALVVAMIGLALGTLAAWGAGRMITEMLFQTHPMDARAIGGAAAVLLGIAMIASVGPSWHAARLDPALTLRRE